MKITSRSNFLPMFLALSCLVLLFIPIYYVDLWSTLEANAARQRVTEDHQEPPEEPTTTDRPPESAELDFLEKDNSSIYNETNNITQFEMTILPIYNESKQKPWPRLPNVPLTANQNNNGISNLIMTGFPISNHPAADMAEFALRMSRHRLRIEMYGPTPLKNNKANHGHSDNRIESDSTKAVEENDTFLQGGTNQLLIVTYFRGGTTFFGDLLNEYPGTFYHFEPLHMVTLNDQVRSDEDVAESIDLLRHLLRCEYENVSHYVKYVRKANHRFLFEHNRRLWFSCQFHPSLCFEETFLSSICKIHPIHVFKLVRLRLVQAKRLLDEFPSLRIIYLVRDPRGLYSSRRDLNWCNATRSCIDPYSYCEDMRQDLAVAIKLKATMPNRFLALRYEDISIDTVNQANRTLDFLGLSPKPSVQRFIKTHTKARAGENLGGPYTTKRDSKKTPFAWRSKLSYKEIEYVEDACSDVIKRLNFS